MTVAGFRRIALSLPEAVEGSHFGNADFRVGGKIFATLALERQGYGVLLLTPEQQAGMVGRAGDLFARSRWMGKEGLHAGKPCESDRRHTRSRVADSLAQEGAQASFADRGIPWALTL